MINLSDAKRLSSAQIETRLVEAEEDGVPGDAPLLPLDVTAPGVAQEIPPWLKQGLIVERQGVYYITRDGIELLVASRARYNVALRLKVLDRMRRVTSNEGGK